MNTTIDKKKIIEAIQRGLKNARDSIYASNTITDNRKHMEKWDRINTSIGSAFEVDDSYIFIPLDRGLFKPIMMFDKTNKVLYTVIKKQNYKKLMDRKSIEKTHYIDAMLDYNYEYQKAPAQTCLFDEESFFSDSAQRQIVELKNMIESLLSINEIQKYFTIVIDFSGYELSEAQCVLCSKWLTEIASENWSDYITPSYEDIEDNGKIDYVPEVNMETIINIKPSKIEEEKMS